jgi:DNA modification methylase
MSAKKEKLLVNNDLNRGLVSFQDNRDKPFVRWMKYREGFSEKIVQYFIEHYEKETSHKPKNILDPFVGSGTTLNVASSLGIKSDGIELMPVGTKIVEARKAAYEVSKHELISAVQETLLNYRKNDQQNIFTHNKLTEGAFPKSNADKLSKYRGYIAKYQEQNEPLFKLLDVASFSILEEISYTRKDGQFIRWDHRANKGKGKFDKGEISDFNDLIQKKLKEIVEDVSSIEQTDTNKKALLNIISGSSLYKINQIENNTFDMCITSPPYCNRYDYTRTYALELAYLGLTNESVKQLRQELLSCTVENREKVEHLKSYYHGMGRDNDFERVLSVVSKNRKLQNSLSFLKQAAESGELNNPNIHRMVKNYFFEMSLLIETIFQKMKVGSKFYMVNDNVQYCGREIEVDIILSGMAEELGFEVEVIWVLPKGKGNSSQQMGIHGRNEIRKCVYVWKK